MKVKDMTDREVLSLLEHEEYKETVKKARERLKAILKEPA